MQQFLVRLRIGEAQLVAHHAHAHLAAHAHKIPDPADHAVQVLLFRPENLDLGILFELAQVEQAEGAHQIPVEGGGQLVGVGLLNVRPHALVGVGRAHAGAGVGGAGLAEDQLADLHVQVGGQLLENLRIALRLGVDELNGHAVGDDGGVVGGDVAHGPEQHALVVLGGAGAVLAHAQGVAVDLAKDDPVLEVAVLEEPGPGRGAGQPAPDGQAALGPAAVDHELAGGQRLQPAGLAAQERPRAGGWLEAEPAGVAPLQALRKPLTAFGVPENFADGKALAHGIHDVEEGRAEHVHALPHEVGGVHVRLVVGGAFHRHFKAGDLQLARGQDAAVVQVLFLHLLGQLQIGLLVAALGLEHEGCHALRVDAVRGMAGNRRTHAGDGGAGELPFE